MGQSPFPVPASVVKALEENAFQKDYLPVKGLSALRKAVAEYNQRTLGIASNVEDILIEPGSKELLFLLQLVYGGELINAWQSSSNFTPQLPQ